MRRRKPAKPRSHTAQTPAELAVTVAASVLYSRIKQALVFRNRDSSAVKRWTPSHN
jgi:hypothetical protein